MCPIRLIRKILLVLTLFTLFGVVGVTLPAQPAQAATQAAPVRVARSRDGLYCAAWRYLERDWSPLWGDGAGVGIIQ